MENLGVGTVCGLVTLTHKENVFKDGRNRGNWWVGECACGRTVGPYTPAHWKKKIRSCSDCRYGNRRSLRKSGDHNPAMSTYGNYRTRARQRGLSFDLSFEKFVEVATEPCVYCMAEQTSYFGATQDWEEDFKYTGIDRKDSSRGYELDNVQACCKICNRAKSDISHEEFLAWVDRVYRLNVQFRTLTRQ